MTTFGDLFELLDKDSKMMVHGIGRMTYIFKKCQFPHLDYKELCNLEVVSIKVIDYLGPCIDVEVID